MLGIPYEFIEHGTQQELYEICGYDYKSVASTVKKIFAEEKVK